MKVISPPTVEPITLELARKQCKVDAELVGSPPTLVHEDDELITLFLKAAREWCEKYTGRAIAGTMVQISLDEFPSGDIALEGGPVVGNVSVLYTDKDDVPQQVESSVYRVDVNGQIALLKLNTDETWPEAGVGGDAVQVHYSIGYSSVGESPYDQPLPDSIRVAILLILGHLYKNRENTVDTNLSEIPMGAKFFLEPFVLRRRFA